jgi:hypothetical protein
MSTTSFSQASSVTDPFVAPIAAPVQEEPHPVNFPLSWLLRNASPPIQYRAIKDIAESESWAAEVSSLAYASEQGVALGVTQSPDGSWNSAMLTVPAAKSAGGGGAGSAGSVSGVGTIYAFRRLLEYGWAAESPPLHHARRLLFRLLAVDEDPSFAFELVDKKNPDHDSVVRARALLREAAAAVLAQGGYAKDPRVRGAATRICNRLDEFLRSPSAASPLIRVGNHHVLGPDAAPPSVWTLLMLSYMPLFRTERFEMMDRLASYLAAPAPRTPPAIAIDREVVAMPHLILGDQLSTIVGAGQDLPWALSWLEMMARMGFLTGNDSWSQILDKLLAQRDAEGVWRSRRLTTAPRSSNPFTWPAFPLEEHLGEEGRWTDITFRLGLIARIAGRPINLV